MNYGHSCCREVGLGGALGEPWAGDWRDVVSSAPFSMTVSALPLTSQYDRSTVVCCHEVALHANKQLTSPGGP